MLSASTASTNTLAICAATESHTLLHTLHHTLHHHDQLLMLFFSLALPLLTLHTLRRRECDKRRTDVAGVAKKRVISLSQG